MNDIKANLRESEVIKAVKESESLYRRFAKKYVKIFDLTKPESIDIVFKEAQKKGILEKAKNIRELIFGKDITFYGVVYLWDRCCNYCIYCPGSVTNRKKAIEAGKHYTLRELTIEEAVDDTKAVMSDGHRHICLLTGSWPGHKLYPWKMKPYLEAFDKLGLSEIILNIPPQTREGFKILRSAVKKTSLQFRVFQETYNRKVYEKVHPAGPKSNYDFRINSQSRALEAGFDNVGLGVLFGLNRYPIEEINDLQKHSKMLERKHGEKPVRVCLPSGNSLEGIDVEIPFILEKGKYDKYGELLKPNIYEKFNELIYAFTRLAMPEISIVSSERDPSGILKILDSYATNTTLNVHPGVGENIEFHKKHKIKKDKREVHFEQATVFPRDPKKTIEDMRRRGFNPIL